MIITLLLLYAIHHSITASYQSAKSPCGILALTLSFTFFQEEYQEYTSF